MQKHRQHFDLTCEVKWEHACWHMQPACLCMSVISLWFMCIINTFFWYWRDLIITVHHLELFCVVFLQGLCSASTVSLPESLLFVSTLDGNLHAVSKKSGSIKWTLKEGKREGREFLFVCLFCVPFSGYICEKQSVFVSGGRERQRGPTAVFEPQWSHFEFCYFHHYFMPWKVQYNHK